MKNKYLIIVALVIGIIGIGYWYKVSKEEPKIEDNLENVKIGMGYIPNVQFVPFYVAEELGYYQEVGIEPTFDYAISTDLLKILGQGELDFVIASGDEVILAVDKDIPVKYVMTLYPRLPIAIASLKESNIQSPADLVGKKIGLPGFYGSSYIALQTFLDNQGIAPENVSLEAIGYAQVQTLMEKKVEAAVVYSMNEPEQILSQGQEPNVIQLSDYLDYASAGIITSDKQLEDRDLVEKFVRATERGMNKAYENPNEAYEIVKKYVEIPSDQDELQRRIMDQSMVFWLEDGVFAPSIDEITWENTANILKDQELISSDLDLNLCYDNSFVSTVAE